MKKVSSKCDKYLRDRYRNLKVVEDSWLNTENPVHILPTFFEAKMITRTEDDSPNVSGFSKGPGKNYERIEIKDMLKFDADGKDRKLVLIECAPGCGKSTTARYLCWLYAEDKFGQEYKLFIIIPLRMLKNTDCSDIKDLVMFVFPKDLQKAAVEEISARNGCNVLFLFEGWDERPPKCAVVNYILDGLELPASSVIITSRFNSAGKLYNKMNRRVELAPFSPSDRVVYIKKKFDIHKGKDSKGKADSLISLLSDHQELESLCSNPMILSMICFTHHKDDCKALSTTTRVYERFICLVANRYLKEKQECSESGVEKAWDVFKHGSLLGFCQYAKLALKGVQMRKFVFRNKDLKFDLTRDCERTGIVLKYTQLRYVGFEGTSYQFLHDSVQFFLAALEMSERTEEEQLLILKKYIKSLYDVHPSEEDEYLSQLGDHRYKRQYSEELDSSQKYEPKLSDPQALLLQFFAGITCMKNEEISGIAGLSNPAINSALIDASKKVAHDQWCKSALPLILYESQNKELTKDIMREVLKPQIVVSCQDNFRLRCTAWCIAQAERKVEELSIILREHIRLQQFCDTCNDLAHLKTLTIRGSVSTSGE